jgi:O-antigen/teichoic acid export membrane protein
MRKMTDQPPRRIAVNSGYLLIAYGVEALLSLLLLSLVARYLDQAGFGRYGYVISFIELFIMLTELSSSRVQIREMASDLAHAKKPLSDVWTLRLGLSLATLAAVMLAAPGLRSDPELWWSIVLFAVGQVLFVLGEIFNSVYRAYQQMRYQTYTVIAGQVLITALCIPAILFDWGLIGLFAVRVVANLLRLVYAWHLARTRFIETHLSRDWRSMRRIFKDSLPLGINLILRRLIWRGGVVMVANLLNQQAPGQGDLAVGLIYGPLRLVEQLRIIPASLVGAILPVFAQQARLERARFRVTLARSFKLYLALSLLLTVVMTALAQPITRIVLGQALIGSAAMLAAMSWSIPFSFLSQFLEAALLAIGRQAIVAVGLGAGFLIGALATLFYLAPTYQGFGLVYGILLAEGIAFVVGLAALLPEMNARALLSAALKIALSCAAAFGVFYVLRHAAIWLSAPAGLLAFVAVILLTRTFSTKELEAVFTMVTFHPRLRPIRHKLFGHHAGSAPEASYDEPL